MLPTYRENAEGALAAAEAAATAGLDGVFAFDHLWPMGHPERPALAPFPVLAAVAVRWPSLCVGPLVARVGLFGSDHLIEYFATLDSLAPGRVIAALGTGDHLSRDEQLAYGLPYKSATVRRAMLADAIEALAPKMTVWCGAGSPATNELARNLGVTLNLWDVSPVVVAEFASSGPVSWAGPLGDDPAAVLTGLSRAGAAWAVASAVSSIERLAEWRSSQ